MYLDNNWYSHRKILSIYCNTKEKPCFASIQHGWYPFMGDHKKPFISKAPYLCWNKRTYKDIRENNIDNVRIIGSPFIYLLKILKKKNKFINTKGTIFFAAHTVPKTDKPIKVPNKFKDQISDIDVEISKEVDHELIIRKIEKISPAPYTACFSHTDYKKINIDIYKKRGWEVITLGKRTDSMMLFNFYNEVIKYKNVISSELGSAVFYALFLKKNVKVIFEMDNININGNKNNPFIKKIFYNNYPELYDSFLGGVKGYELAKEELGAESILTRHELKKTLGWDNSFKNLFSKIYSLRNIF
jgi:hypothetical protein